MYRQIVKAKLFIDEFFTENLDLETIAIKAHFSKFHFLRLFKNIYGQTPNQYLTQVRVEHSKKLLQKGHSVKEVCMSVGFDSISTFKGLFRKHTGETLSSYQYKQTSLQQSMKNNPLIHIPHCLTRIKDIRKSNFQDPCRKQS